MATTLMTSLLSAVLLSHCVTSLDVASYRPQVMGLEQSLVAMGKHVHAHQTLASDVALQDTLTLLGSKLTGDGLLTLIEEAVGNATTECYQDMIRIVTGVQEKQTWARKMLDALGKPKSGFLEGNTAWLGSYGECMEVKEGTQNPFHGEYCMTYVLPNAITQQVLFRFGGCYPSTCNTSHISAMFTEILNRALDHYISYAYVTCSNPKTELDTAAIVVTVILSIFLALMVFGTVYDVVCIQMPKWEEKKRQKVMVNGDAGSPDSIRLEIDKVTAPGEKSPLLEKDRKEDHKEPKPSVAARLLVSFSVYTNGQKLLNTKQPPGSLTAVHGMRFISMTWVLLGHSFSFGMQYWGNPLPYIMEVYDRWSYLAIVNATVSVDTFFLLSGLLVAYMLTKELERSRSPLKVNWALFYFHRFWRLTPPYMFVMMVYVPLLAYMGSGPMWPDDGMDPNCKDNWWTNLLYVNNVVNTEKMCMGWSWYLANDMQFYILSPFILIPLFMFPVVGLGVAFAFLLATVITSGVVSQHNNLVPGIGLNGPGSVAAPVTNVYMDKYYMKPWCRMGPYVIGLLVGYVLQRTKCKVNMHKAVALLGWCCAAATCLAVIYGVWPQSKGGEPMTVEVAALYNALNRTAWAIGVGWVVFACATGYGGFVDMLLSWKAMIPLSRLTYCCYLVHPVVVSAYYMSMQDLQAISDITMVYQFLGNLMMTYGVALVASLAFEAPMLGLEKVIFNKS